MPKGISYNKVVKPLLPPTLSLVFYIQFLPLWIIIKCKEHTLCNHSTFRKETFTVSFKKSGINIGVINVPIAS